MNCFRLFIFTSFLLQLGITGTASASSEEKKESDKIPKAASVEKVSDANMLETQRQLEDVIQVHKNLQLEHQREIEEIQKIIEQARTHQKLLKDLSQEKGLSAGASSPVTKIDLEQAIRSQKIQLMKEQTEKNRTETREPEEKAKKES